MFRPIVYLLLLITPILRADEPTKPTESPTSTNPATPAAGHSVHGNAFDDGPRTRARLLEGQGKVDFPITTTSKEAQAFFSQGVAQLHTFYYYEAERSFRQAALLDKESPMPAWGMAMANTNNAKRAKGFLKDAADKLAKTKISKREQLYIDALNVFYKDGDDKSKKQGWLAGLEEIVQEFPGDLDARAWMAMVAWQNGGDGASKKAVDVVIETVMNVEPMHPGAHHYRIHLWDGPKAIRAEKSAATYAKTAPGIAHAWHMPGHIYTDMKRYSDAAYQQEGSARADHAAMTLLKTMPFEIHNYSHNNQWFVTSASNVGRVKDALAMAKNLVEQPRDPNKNGPNDGGSPQRNGRLRWAELLERYEMWPELIEATTTGKIDWSDIAFEKQRKAYSLGLAYAATDQTPKLSEQINALKEALPKKDAKATPPASGAKLSGGDAMLAELEGYLLLATGVVQPAFDKFAQAGTMRGESLARAHLKARNFGFAESSAKSAMEGSPKQMPPIATYVEILAACGKIKESQEAYAQLVPYLKEADQDLSCLSRIASLVSTWTSNGGWNAPASVVVTDEASAGRQDLATVGPLGWQPFASAPLSLPDTDGKSWSLADRKGKNVIVLFYLGGKCAHCMQQLTAFGKEVEAFAKLDTEVVAVSTDELEATRSLKKNEEGIKFPMPLLADPMLGFFKSWASYNDFEAVPLHGTFLIDSQGNVRWQKVASDPFLDVDFLKKETARVSKLLK